MPYIRYALNNICSLDPVVGSLSTSIFFHARLVVHSTNVALARVASSSKLPGCYIISGSEISCRSHLTSSRFHHVGTIPFMKLEITYCSVTTFLLNVVLICQLLNTQTW